MAGQNISPVIGLRQIIAGTIGLRGIGNQKEKDGFGCRGIGISVINYKIDKACAVVQAFVLFY